MNRLSKWAALLLIALPLHLKAQNLDKKKFKAEGYFYTEKYEKAREAYEEILEVSPSYNLGKYRVEICSLLTNAKYKSTAILESYSKTQGRKDKFYNYWMAKIYFNQNHFKKAIEACDRFLGLKQFKTKEITEEVKQLKARAVLIDDYYSKPDNYEVEHLHTNVNSTYNESSPVYFRDKEELLFLSSRPLNGDNSKKETFYIYESKRDGEEWASPKVISVLGEYESKNANIEVVRNDGRLFVYLEKKGGELYYSELNGGRWAELKEFDASITSSKMESHFFINEHENKVLFADRKKEGGKDLDIYQSTKDPNTGEWSAPQHITSLINSDQDEDYPYLSADENTLYFSSKGHGSIGGYDVFKSEFDEGTGTWSEPTALRYPMNTPDDDIQFKIDEELNSGYFVSDRYESKGGFDIFFFHPSDKVFVEGTLSDAKGQKVNQAEISFIPKRSTGLLVKSMTDEEGHFKVTVGVEDEISVVIKINQKVVHTDKFETPTAKASTGTFEIDFTLPGEKESIEEIELDHKDPKYTKVEDITNKFRHSNKARIGNIYFAVNDYKLPADGSEKLQALLNALHQNPVLKFEISGHTDNRGDANENLILSHKRAESVIAFLVSEGIDQSRLVAKGYGETMPLASNDDEENGRELNRRIEVAVLE